jgi:hypothetical protein
MAESTPGMPPSSTMLFESLYAEEMSILIEFMRLIDGGFVLVLHTNLLDSWAQKLCHTAAPKAFLRASQSLPTPLESLNVRGFCRRFAIAFLWQGIILEAFNMVMAYN